MSIKIDKGIPVPANAGTKYPFREMEVGDSFFVPDKTSQAFGGIFNNYKPKRFCSRTSVENGIKGIRVWRLE